jgi:hypothetical protein
MCPPFRASWQMAVRPSILFPSPPLKFRTAGFPQYGFKPDRPAATFAAFAVYRRPVALSAPALLAPNGGNRRLAAAYRQVPAGRSDPEALGSASGYSVPSRLRLLWPHPSLWASPADLWLSSAGLCLAAKAQRVPDLSCVSVFPCRLLYPGGPGGHDCCTSCPFNKPHLPLCARRR